jgi:hypothetical protein
MALAEIGRLSVASMVSRVGQALAVDVVSLFYRTATSARPRATSSATRASPARGAARRGRDPASTTRRRGGDRKPAVRVVLDALAESSASASGSGLGRRSDGSVMLLEI